MSETCECQAENLFTCSVCGGFAADNMRFVPDCHDHGQRCGHCDGYGICRRCYASVRVLEADSCTNCSPRKCDDCDTYATESVANEESCEVCGEYHCGNCGYHCVHCSKYLCNDCITKNNYCPTSGCFDFICDCENRFDTCTHCGAKHCRKCIKLQCKSSDEKTRCDTKICKTCSTYDRQLVCACGQCLVNCTEKMACVMCRLDKCVHQIALDNSVVCVCMTCVQAFNVTHKPLVATEAAAAETVEEIDQQQLMQHLKRRKIN